MLFKLLNAANVRQVCFHPTSEFSGVFLAVFVVVQHQRFGLTSLIYLILIQLSQRNNIDEELLRNIYRKYCFEKEYYLLVKGVRMLFLRARVRLLLLGDRHFKRVVHHLTIVLVLKMLVIIGFRKSWQRFFQLFMCVDLGFISFSYLVYLL